MSQHMDMQMFKQERQKHRRSVTSIKMGSKILRIYVWYMLDRDQLVRIKSFALISQSVHGLSDFSLANEQPQ